MKVNGHIQLYPFMRIVVALIIGIVVGDAYNSVVNKASDVWNGIKEKKETACDKAEDAFDAAEEKVEDIIEEIKSEIEKED